MAPWPTVNQFEQSDLGTDAAMKSEHYVWDKLAHQDALS